MWKDLSMREKAAFMRVAIKNGITDLGFIRDNYNSFAEGGPLNEDYTQESWYEPWMQGRGMFYKTHPEYIDRDRIRFTSKTKERTIHRGENNVQEATESLREVGDALYNSAQRDREKARYMIEANNAYQEEKKQEKIEDFYPYKLYMKSVPVALAGYSLGLSAKELLGHPLTATQKFYQVGADATGSVLDFIQAGAGIHDKNYKATGINSAQGIIGGVGALGASNYLQGLGTKGKIADKVLDYMNVGSNAWEIVDNLFQK